MANLQPIQLSHHNVSGGQILSDESVNFVAKFRHMCMHKIRGNVRDICSLNFYGFNVFVVVPLAMHVLPD